MSAGEKLYSCASSLRPLPCKVLQGLVLSLFLFVICWRAIGKVMRSRGLRYHQSVDGNQLICLFSADAISAMTQMSQNLQEISLQVKISWLKLTWRRKRCCWKEGGELDVVKAVRESCFHLGKCSVVWGPGVDHVACGFSLACKVLVSFSVCSAVIFCGKSDSFYLLWEATRGLSRLKREQRIKLVK